MSNLLRKYKRTKAQRDYKENYAGDELIVYKYDGDAKPVYKKKKEIEKLEKAKEDNNK